MDEPGSATTPGGPIYYVRERGMPRDARGPAGRNKNNGRCGHGNGREMVEIVSAGGKPGDQDTSDQDEG